MPKSVVLTDKENDAIIRAAVKGDKKAVDIFVKQNLWLAKYIARGFRNYGLPHDDIFQEACCGMMIALKKFDPDRGTKFSTYAVIYMRMTIFEFVVRNRRIVHAATTKDGRKLFFNFHALKNKGLSTEEIAEYLNVKQSEVLRMEGFFKNYDEGVDDDSSPYLSFEMEDHAIREMDDVKMKSIVDSAIMKLDPRERDIIGSRYFSETPETLTALGDKYGISAERVRQLEKRSLQSLGTMIPDFRQ